MSDLIGLTLLNQFRVEAFVASGGMGAVYRVWDLKRNVPLAMKVLHADLADEPSILIRFQREANALKKLAHPNIVPFYGLYQTQDFAFLLERFVDGPSLKQVLNRRPEKRLLIEEALIIHKALCAALGYAHANGVIHCDVKPGNVMVDAGGNVYLTDFGVARHAESTTTTLATVGTAAYMAPEQIRGEPVSPPTDIYALGIVLFEMLAGRRPFQGDEKGTEGAGTTAGERIRSAHLHLPPPDPRKFNREIPPALAEVVLRALAKQPEDRFQSMQEFIAAASKATGMPIYQTPDRLKTVIEGSPQQTAASAVNLQAQGEIGTLSRSAAAPLTRGLPRWARGLGLVVFGGTGLLGFIIFLIVFLGGRSDSDGGIALTPAVTQVVVVVTATSPTSGETLSAVHISPTPAPQEQDQFGETSVSQEIANSTPQPTAMVETAEPHAGETRENTIDSAELVYVPGGPFLRGIDEGMLSTLLKQCGLCKRSNFEDALILREIEISPFWINKTEVTNAQYQRCVESGSCDPPRQFGSRTITSYYNDPVYSDYPVLHVPWSGAVKYCEWAGGRLPTEAEWEKAARGTDGNLYPWGNQAANCNLANVARCNRGVGDPTEVGSYPQGASPYGVLDLAGNVYEWIADWYSREYYEDSPSIDPEGPPNGEDRGIRGGSADYRNGFASSVYRDSHPPHEATDQIGLRCVLDN